MSAAVSRVLTLLLALAAPACAAEPLFKWGSGQSEVGGGPALADGREGIPAAWAGAGDALEILDTINRRIVRAQHPPVDLTKALGAECHPVDFAAVTDGWVVSDRASGAVARIARDGSLVRKWSGLQRAGRVEVDALGTPHVHDEVALAILRCEPDGKTTEVVERFVPHATPLAAPEKRLWCARVMLGRGVLGTAAGHVGRVTAVYRPAKEGSTVQGIEVAGAAGDHLLLAMHEGKGDDRHGVRLVRVTHEGTIVAEARAPAVDERWLTIPRFFRAAGPDTVTSFRAGDDGWRPVTYTLKPVPPIEPAGRPKSALVVSCDAMTPGDVLEHALAYAFSPNNEHEDWVPLLHEGVPLTELCALSRAQGAFVEGRFGEALRIVEKVGHAKLADRRLWTEAHARERMGELRPALRLYQKLVLEHPSSTYYGAAQEGVLRIVESGKLPGARAP